VAGYSGALQIELRERAGLERRSEPVRAGLPFPRWALTRAENVRVLLSDGREIDSQRRVLARWPDGSVRWLELLFEPSVAANAVGRYRVEFGPKIKAAKVAGPLTASADKDTIRVDTGRLQLEIAVRGGRLRAWFDRDGDGKYAAADLVLAGPGLESFVELGGRSKGAAAGRFVGVGSARLERTGPLRAVVAWRGWHVDRAGRKVCPYQLRLYAYRGRSRLRLVHTLVISEPAAASGVVEAGLAVRLAPGRPALPAHRLVQEVELSKRYPDLAGFHSGFKLLEGRRQLAGGGARGFIECRSERFRLAAAMPRPAEGAPWELRLENRPRGLVAAFWPRWGRVHTDTRSPEEREAPGFLEFTRTESCERFWTPTPKSHGAGAARSHELWLDFGPPGGSKGAAADFGARVSSPLLAWPGHEWIKLCGVFGRLAPRRRAGREQRPEWAAGAERLNGWLRLHQRRRCGWLGIWDYGDYQTVYRRRGDLDVGERWWNWHGEWGWMQGRADLGAALLVPWLASGGAREWERFRAAVVHNIDVDTVHSCGRPAGMTGATHGPGATHWSGKAALRWTYPAAWLDHYYLSGEPRGPEMLTALLNSIGDKTIDDLRSKGQPWTPDQAGYLRARLAACEIFGKEHRKAAASALSLFARLSGRELGSSGEWARGLAPALIRYHRLTGDSVVAELIEKGTRAYVSSRGPAGRDGVVARNCFDACAYAWRLSGDRYFLERGRQLAERSAAQTAAERKIDENVGIPADLALDGRVIQEVGTLPYLEAALREAAAEK
jgi:hypothetical protein